VKRAFLLWAVLSMLAGAPFSLAAHEATSTAEELSAEYGDMIDGGEAAYKGGIPVIGAIFAPLFHTVVRQYGYQEELPDRTLGFFYTLIGPSRMLDALEAEQSDCHVQSHKVGRLIYERTQDVARSLQIAGGRCLSGAFHGVLMGMLDTYSDNFDLDTIGKDAIAFCEREDVEGRYGRGVCAHGFGHAFYNLADSDIDQTMSLCESFNTAGLRYYCATGMYMQISLDRDAFPQDSRAPFSCEGRQYPAACYRYLLQESYRSNEHEAARSHCLMLRKEDDKIGCFHALGVRHRAVMLDDPSLMPVVCTGAGNIATRMCVEGAAGRVATGNVDDATKICDAQAEPIRSWCYRGRDLRNFGMGRDFNGYIKKTEGD
jgi:hypothetical protein